MNKLNYGASTEAEPRKYKYAITNKTKGYAKLKLKIREIPDFKYPDITNI